MDGVVLQQMGQRFGIGDVVDADELNLGLLRHGGRAQYVAADSSEPVDPYPHRHDCSLGEVWNCGARERHALDPRRAGLLEGTRCLSERRAGCKNIIDQD